MKQIELKEKRKLREKHFLKENGEMIAYVYDENVHYLDNGVYKDIDNTLISDGLSFVNKQNQYRVKFYHNQRKMMNFKFKNNNVEISLKDSNYIKPEIIDKMSKLHSYIVYENILDNISINYKIEPESIKESIVLKKRNNYTNFNDISFIINTNHNLSVNADGSINLFDGYVIEKPIMYDLNNKTCDNIKYKLLKIEKGYELKLVLDKEWLQREDIVYPVIIDPTITNNYNDHNVYDTYISSYEPSSNKGSEDLLKVGVEKINNMEYAYRTLIKFELPNIGTSSQVIDAQLDLIGYPILNNPYNTNIINIYRVTSDWDENSATWNNMNNKYDSKIESTMFCSHSTTNNNQLIPQHNIFKITNLVKKWYTNVPNFGMMLILNEETYSDKSVSSFYSKNNSVSGSNPKPLLKITYRNQNGLEDYMNYFQQSITRGTIYQNLYNGNLTAMFGLTETYGGHLPISLSIVYNTNDVVLNNNYGFGLGYKLNYYQTIKKVIIDNNEYLEYLDQDGTVHYFYKNGDVYKDEDNSNNTIEKKDNDYILKSSEQEFYFLTINDVSYLKFISDNDDNTISIYYDQNLRINKICDGSSQEITINYGDNIVVSSPADDVILYYNLGCLNRIKGSDRDTIIEYNEQNLITMIIEENGMKYNYEYYQNQPYKVSLISECGRNNELGKSYRFKYGFCETEVIDENEKSIVYTFNSIGNVISCISYNNDNSIIGAYGKSCLIGENNSIKNRPYKDTVTEKHVKNLLINTDFEENLIIFNSDNTIMSISNEFFNSGYNSLKLEGSLTNSFIYYEMNLKKEKYYTFSAFIKNNCPIKLQLSYIDENDEIVNSQSNIIFNSNDFERNEVTIFYPENSNSNLIIKIVFVEPGVAYVDNIQLEEGMVANNYNYIENSDFSNGSNGWLLSAYEQGISIDSNDKFQIVNVEEEQNALKVIMNPKYETKIEKTFNIKGKAGEVFNVSFWYKNNGIEKSDIITDNIVSLYFNYDDELLNQRCMLYDSLNSSCENWQYFSSSFVALGDFNSITLIFWQVFNGNDFYLTNISFVKNLMNIIFEYDDNGNVINVKHNSKESAFFNYNKNNQLMKLTNAVGKSFTYEYDSKCCDKVISGLSSLGISNDIMYDERGNPYATKILNKNVDLNNINNNESALCSIRVCGTRKYLKNIKNNIRVGLECSGHSKWLICPNNGFYSIRHSIICDKYFTVQNNDIILNSYQNENSLFSFIKNDDCSFSIKLANSDKYIRYHNDSLELSELTDDDKNFHFYLENENDCTFIENDSIYDENNRFITEIIDSNLNKSKYQYNNDTGELEYKIAPNNVCTEYIYNNRQLASIRNADKEVFYYYDVNTKLLNEIKFGKMNYKLLYDNFLNIKKISVGDNITLINNTFESRNGNLIATSYGNNDIIYYVYDYYDRLIEKTKMEDRYLYFYSSNNDLLKTISNNHAVSYQYDNEKRLNYYQFDSFINKFEYDEKDDITKEVHKLDGIENVINYIFNDDGEVKELNFENNNIKYTYDEIGRLISESINSGYLKTYSYKQNGKRATHLIDSINFGNLSISYRYDELNNITQIYVNDSLIKRYKYDSLGQLICEKDYINNYYIKYSYNQNGNMISKKKCNLDDYNIISYDRFQYNNSWADQMSLYNELAITYDEIGNIISIGDATLEWINGRELKKYQDNEYLIRYEYDDNSIRLSKTVNNKKTEYFYIKNQLLFEKNIDGIIFYLRDNDGNLLGLKYNNNWYFYVKNVQNDIIGLIDNNGTIVAKYAYDSWGNIISIKDALGNDITDMSHIAYRNSFRYRSYYFDNETGLYYLGKRYYNPKLMRFINADSYISTGCGILGYNMYIYANNNPINNSDDNGMILRSLRKKIKSISKKTKRKIVKTIAKAASSIAVSIIKNKVSKYIQSLKQSFVIEAGLGAGMSTNEKVLGGRAHTTISYKYKKKKTTKHLNKTMGYSLMDIGATYQSSCTYNAKGECPTHIVYKGEKIPMFDYSETVSMDIFNIVSIDTYGRMFIGSEFEMFPTSIGVGGFIRIGFENDDYADADHKFFDD